MTEVPFQKKNFFDKIPSAIAIVIIATICITLLIVLVNNYKPFVAGKELAFVIGIVCAFLFTIFYFSSQNKISFPKKRIVLAIFLFMAYTLINSFFHTFVDYWWLTLVCGCLLLTIIMILAIEQKHHMWIITSLSLVTIIIGIYSTLQYIGIDYGAFINYFGSRSTIGMRTFATLGNPNLLGGFGAFMLPILIGLIIEAGTKLYEKVHENKNQKNTTSKKTLVKELIVVSVAGISIIGCLIAIITAQTRGSWLALVMTAGFGAILLLFTNRTQIISVITKNKGIILGIAGIISILIIGMIFAIQKEDLLNPTTVNIRELYYTTTIDMITESPLTFIFGRGIGSFNVWYPQYRDARESFKNGETSLEYRVENPHSEHLEQLHDGGILGYILFLWIAIEAAVLLYRQKRPLYYGVLFGIIALLCDGLFSQNLRFISIVVLLWLAYGIAGSCDKQPQQKRNSENNKVKITQGIIITAIIGILCLFPITHALNNMVADQYVKQGLSYYLRKDPQSLEKAHVALLKAYELEQTNKRALYYLAITSMSLNKNDDAKKYFNILLQLDPNFIQANFHRATIAYNEKETEIAYEYFSKQIQVNQMVWQAYYGIALLDSEKGNYTHALLMINEVEKIHSINPLPAEGYSAVLKLHANNLITENKTSEALVILEKAHQMTPNDQSIINATLSLQARKSNSLD